jgi:hypothetical protein
LLIPLVQVELFGDNFNTFVGNIVVMYKPIKAIGIGGDVVGHDLFETFIIGNDKEVDHDDVAKFESVDHIGDGHIAEGVQQDKRCFGVIFDVCFNF